MGAQAVRRYGWAEPLALGPVLGVAAGLVMGLVLVAGRYGYH